MKNKDFKPAAGLNWREYVKSGGPARYVGKKARHG